LRTAVGFRINDSTGIKDPLGSAPQRVFSFNISRQNKNSLYQFHIGQSGLPSSALSLISLYRMMLGLLGEFGVSGPTWLAGGGAEPSNTPIIDRMTTRIIKP
jgi:hypothetical protein